MTDVAEIAAGLTKAQRFWLLQAVNGVLSDIATTRMILVGRQGIADSRR